MRKPIFRLKQILIAAALCAPAFANAEDIDLFVSGATSSTANNPNVLIILDNSSNWSSASQHWVSPNPSESPFKQGQSELRALRALIQESNDKVNIGLMMFKGGSVDGTYVRAAMRTMDATHKGNLAALIGDGTCTDGTGGNGTPKCIFKNFDGAEKTATADIDYGAAMFEAFKYYGGCTSPAFAQSGLCKTSPLGRDHFGKNRHSGDFPLSDSAKAFYDQAAYTDSSRDTYIPPSGTANSCAKSYVILIGNGFPKDDIAGSPLANVEGQTTQLSMPRYTTNSNTTQFTNLGSACGTAGGGTTQLANQIANCTANIPQSLKDAHPDKDTFFCVGPALSPKTPCSGGSTERFQINASRTVLQVEETGESGVPAANKARMADEWARFLFTTDVNEAPGVQNVKTYTIDVFKDQQDADQTALLFSMAKYGGGRYFQASSESDILGALRSIMIEIQSVNSVFASASLPINATNRSQNENQVFIGMFRPDPGARPRWYGNLKRYQIAKFGSEFKLGDASSPPREAVTGEFIDPCAKSFWTTDTTTLDNSTAPPTDRSYWNFTDPSGTHIGTCTTSTTSLFSDSPDGPMVEKGAVAQVLRLGNLFNATPDFIEHRTMYTCANTGLATTCNFSPTAMHSFNNTNVGAFALGSTTSADRDRVINFTRGVDVADENSRLTNTDVRPSVHGDVAHSRPLPVNYGGSTGVVLYYGANDGSFRSISGNTGKELWSFIAPEHHSKLKRLVDNGNFGTGLISYPPTPAPGSAPKDYFFDGSAGLFQNVDDTKIWVYPSMRRGGRMLYAFDVTVPTAPLLKWRLGCTSASMADTASCINAAGTISTDFAQMGQTWSTPTVARVKGYSSDPNVPVVIVGGGYDTCEDQDVKPNTACTALGYVRRGNRVFVIDANTGNRLASFATDGSVPADVTVIDRDFDGMVDHAYVADTLGGIYRIDFVDPANVGSVRAQGAWTIAKIGQLDSTSGRRFLFPPAALPTANKVYLALSSGDRERPLINNYPFPVTAGAGVLNRAYMMVDDLSVPGTPLALDGSNMADLSAGTDCSTKPVDDPLFPGGPKRGWYINLNAARNLIADPLDKNMGEQGVTSTLIFAGLVFFSTNRPVPTPVGACAQNLGEARGYALNLLTASGAADTQNICGGLRSGVFLGGGLPPSPVTGTVPVDGKPVTVMIGGIQRGGGASAPIGAQRVTPTITQRRSRVYWYTDTDK